MADGCDVMVSKAPLPCDQLVDWKTYPAEPMVSIDNSNGRAAAIKRRVWAEKIL
jgi:hypothetical protein